MNLRGRITIALKASPKASSYDIAKSLGCTPEYVRTVKQRILIGQNKPPALEARSGSG